VVCILKLFSSSHFGPSTLFFLFLAHRSDRGSIYTGAIAAIRPYRCPRTLPHTGKRELPPWKDAALLGARGQGVFGKRTNYRKLLVPGLPSHNHSRIPFECVARGKEEGSTGTEIVSGDHRLSDAR